MRGISIGSAARPAGAICAGCGWCDWFAPALTDAQATVEMQCAVEHRHAVRRGRPLLRAGEPLQMIYALTRGLLKTSLADLEGRVQVTGFSLPGELVGIEAIAGGSYPCNVTAVEDSICCGIRYADLDRLSHGNGALQNHLHRAMSREINRDHELMFLLGNMSADERVAQFLLNLSARYAALGRSAACFRLSMSRREIASYLGLKVETISRVMTRLNGRRIIAVSGKDIEVRSFEGLQQIVGDDGKRDVAVRAIVPH